MITDNDLIKCDCDCCGSALNKRLYAMPDIRLRDFSREYTVVECKSCGHRYLNPRPNNHALATIYPEKYYANRKADDPNQINRYNFQADFLPASNGKNLLDVGCAGGGWLKVMQQRGWQCTGSDFIASPDMEPGIEVKVGDLPELNFDNAPFDLISAWGVMEHVPAPSSYFKAVNSLLNPGGYFVFMVPNGDSLWSRWAFKEDIPRHLHFYRIKTLSRYAADYGFKIKSKLITHKPYTRPPTGRGLFRLRTLRRLNVSWDETINGPRSIIKRGIAKCGSLLDHLLIHPKLEEYFGLGGNILVVFEKI